MTVFPLTAEEVQRIALSPLSDGTSPPWPTHCVVNSSRPPDDAAVRLFLPIPPYYPDEVRARLWAQRTGYLMAPPTVCAATSVRVSAASGGSGNDAGGDNTGSPASGPVASSYRITSPTPGQSVSGLVPIMGTARFDASSVQYYKLEIGNGRTPSSWVTFGTTHSQPVEGGMLEQLHADGLPSGEYVIRLVLVGLDGNFIGQPHQVPINVVP